MSREERERVVEALPGEVTWEEMAMPEGDRHYLAKQKAREALQGYFKGQRRSVYVATDLPVYYPGERRFAPDLLVVLGAEHYERDKWVVSHEGQGLSWGLEVHVGGDRKKDAEYNVERYARLGIPEYFVFDGAREELLAYRLPAEDPRHYVKLEAERGRLWSSVLGLELSVEQGRLRFWAGNALLLEYEELIGLLTEQVSRLQERVAEEARRLDEEARSRREAERRLAQLQAELERLRGHRA